MLTRNSAARALRPRWQRLFVSLVLAGAAWGFPATAAPLFPQAVVPAPEPVRAQVSIPAARTIPGLVAADLAPVAMVTPRLKPQFAVASPVAKPVPLPKPDRLPVAAPAPKAGKQALAATKTLSLTEAERVCLAQVVYYEARGDIFTGRQAVAEVVLHRVADGRFGRTICDVVYQGSQRRKGCQFSFTCNGIMKRAKDMKSWARSLEMADFVLTGAGRYQNITNGATHFHANTVNPRWAGRLSLVGRIGTHTFYRSRDNRNRIIY
jgi:spore germination cell wall hydrolase CwlJ-like protein